MAHKPPPIGYICYRCGQKGPFLCFIFSDPSAHDPAAPGHWIQDCPTNDDRAYDDRPKIKRTTGIPKSFLTTVEGPGENGQLGVMVTAEGGFVVARPDKCVSAVHFSRLHLLTCRTSQRLVARPPRPHEEPLGDGRAKQIGRAHV